MTKPCDQPGTLFLKTKQLLIEDERDLLTIANETGIPFYWLRTFVQKSEICFKNPSVNRVQYLYEKLTNTPLLAE